MKIHHRLHAHFKHHHKKYLFGIFGSLAIVKTVILFGGFFGLINIVNTFADTPNELNSGNVTTIYNCPITATECNLGDKSISSIALDTFVNHTSLKRLYLKENQLTSIEDGAFNGLSNLEYLFLDNNQISSLDSGAFNGLSALKILSIPSNQLSSINDGVFSGLSNLQYLDLNSNQLTTLKANEFSSLSSLRTLYVFSNKITSLEVGFLNGMPNLSSLNLMDNQITTPIVDGLFNGATHLDVLDLSWNRFSSIGDNAFSGLSSLSQLRLHVNMISSIADNAFNGLSSLNELQLEDNQIGYINIGTFSSENGFSQLTTLMLDTNCSINGTSDVPYGDGLTATIDSENCIIATGESTTPAVAPVEENTAPISQPEEVTPPVAPVEENTAPISQPEEVAPAVAAPVEEITAPATYTLNGGGGSLRAKDTCPNGDFSLSPYDGTCGNIKVIQRISSGETENNLINTSAYTQEYADAYSFAFSNGMISAQTIDDANMKGVLTRSAMAQMISNFATNVLKKTISTGTECSFSDIGNLSKDTQDTIILACELGLMGYANDGVTINATFKPNQTVSRAQFGTILSRLLRGTKYNGGSPYYQNHLNALNDLGIMTKITTPSQKETRGSALVMLQRAAAKQ